MARPRRQAQIGPIHISAGSFLGMHQISAKTRKGLSYSITTARQIAPAVFLYPAKQLLLLSAERSHETFPTAQYARLASLDGLFCVKTAHSGPFGGRPLIGLSLVRFWQNDREAEQKNNLLHE
jgi:hypothetical protein